MARKVSLHKKDVILNREVLDSSLSSFGMGYIDLYEKIVETHGLDLSYKGFMSLLSNRSSWKLLYAYFISESLNTTIEDLFTVVDVDIDKKIKEKNAWKEKYQK